MSHQYKKIHRIHKLKKSPTSQIVFIASITLTVIIIFYLNFHYNFNFNPVPKSSQYEIIPSALKSNIKYENSQSQNYNYQNFQQFPNQNQIPSSGQQKEQEQKSFTSTSPSPSPFDSEIEEGTKSKKKFKGQDNNKSVSDSEHLILDIHDPEKIVPNLYPKPWKIIDLIIQYLLNSDVCSPNSRLNQVRSKIKGSQSHGQDQGKGQAGQSKGQSEGQENERILVLMLITSHAAHFTLRQRLREILPTDDLKKLKMRRVFLLARATPSGNFERGNKKTEFVKKLNSKPENAENKDADPDFPDFHDPEAGPGPDPDPGTENEEFAGYDQLKREQEENSDLVMGSFMESYHNLTYKHLMGLQWATRYCPQAQFVMKQDDDILVDYYQLAEILKGKRNKTKSKYPVIQEILDKIQEESKFITGKPLERQRVIRDPQSKWFVTPGDYFGEFYPTFVSGWAYLTTIETVKELLFEAEKKKYFWIDDVHITGTLRQSARIQVIDLSKLFTQYKGHLLCCLSPSLIRRKKGFGFGSDFGSRQEPFWCDFVIGPTMDDWGLFLNLHQHARFCYTSQVCVRRDEREELNKTCVITEQRLKTYSHFSVLSESNMKESGSRGSYSFNVKERRGRGEWKVLNL